MEVLLVLVILVILGSMVGIFIRRARQQAFVSSAQSQIGLFKGGLKFYEGDVHNFPTTDQGLVALYEEPAGLPPGVVWDGKYLDGNDVPLDPWKNPYQYELLDADTYRIWSMGPDGVDGTEDDISDTN